MLRDAVSSYADGSRPLQSYGTRDAVVLGKTTRRLANCAVAGTLAAALMAVRLCHLPGIPVNAQAHNVKVLLRMCLLTGVWGTDSIMAISCTVQLIMLRTVSFRREL